MTLLVSIMGLVDSTPHYFIYLNLLLVTKTVLNCISLYHGLDSTTYTLHSVCLTLMPNHSMACLYLTLHDSNLVLLHFTLVWLYLTLVTLLHSTDPI